MLPFLYTLSISLMIAMPVILAVLHRRRFGTPWFLFCVGIITFTVSQAIHLPLNSWLVEIGILPSPEGGSSPPLWQTALVLGLTAGLCEELTRAGGYAILKRYRSFGDGVMMGLGHGGIEAMVFGGVLTAATVSALLPLSGGDFGSLDLTPGQAAALETQLRLLLDSPWQAALPLIERALAILLQVVFSIIVWRAFMLRKPGYVVLAIAYHTFVDAAAVYASQSAVDPWLIEAGFALLVLPGAIWLASIYRQEGQAVARETDPSGSQLAQFWTTLRKELLQQWRTRRVLAVAAVFGLFGLISPLLAYYTPLMLQSIPGGEQFAGLVPTPTSADAISQYIKNISQFGFILAILMGMGAVAGEKEHGTASLILSKPLPRSAFVTSKFAAQVLVYLAGFFLALLGAYFYTLVLFGEGDPSSLVLITLLLFAWLLPYVVVTLIGSVIGGTTTTAAGIALAGSVVLLILSSIPQIGSVLPGALLGWAGQIGAGGALPGANGGALAAVAVLTVVGLITAIAIFERQEL
jgi:ABC-2 type transport system permease protein